MTEVESLLREGAEEGIYPTAQACVFLEGKTVIEGFAGGASEHTVYDLASLTKIISTTACFMSLWGVGKVGPNTPLSRYFTHCPAAQLGVTLGDLLYHRSGLPASVAFFARVMPAVPELFQESCPPSVRHEVREAVIETAARTAPVNEPRDAAVYSDVGFILLGEALAKIAERPLDELFQSQVAGPLALGISYRRLSTSSPAKVEYAPTGNTRPREPAPGQENTWQPFGTFPTRPGEVDDDNAWVMDGVAGHAGLFGPAREVARFGQMILDELDGAGKIAPQALWQLAVLPDTVVLGSTRALGFDTPSKQGSSAGKYVGQRSGAIGHLGFTGVSLWMDLGRKVSIALCTNRTFLGRNESRIRDFRPRFHDAVMKQLGFGGAP